MSPSSLLSCAIVLLASSSSAIAQDEQPVPVPLAQLRAQLAGNEPAQVAWAAYTTGRQQAKELAPELVAVLAKLQRANLNEPAVRAEAAAVLDALIRIDANLRPSALAPWLEHFPVMALILAAREPRRHSGQLLRWLERDRFDLRWLTACNLLVRAVPEMAVPTLLDQVAISLQISVVSTGHIESSFFTACGYACGIGNMQRLDGFPPVVVYTLAAGDPIRGTLLAPGPRSVSYERREHEGRTFRSGGCGPTIDHADYALRCLDMLADREPGEVRLRSEVEEMVEWTTNEQFTAAIANHEASLRAAFAAVLTSLANKGLVSALQATERRLPLRITLDDHRTEQDKKTALPKPDHESEPARR